MKITSNADVIAKEIREYQKLVEKGLFELVSQFAEHLIVTASDNTPIGDQAELDAYFAGSAGFGSGPVFPNKYVSYYLRRVQRYGIEARTGFHQGAWIFSQDASLEFDSTIVDISTMKRAASMDFTNNFKLGEDFYIGAEGPGYRMLEEGGSAQAPDGIMKPTVDQILDIYKMQVTLLTSK
jgi:hypothetical protein